MTNDTIFPEEAFDWHRILSIVSERRSVENDGIEKLRSVDQAYTWLSYISIHVQIRDFHWFEYLECGNIQGMVTDFDLSCAEENHIIETFDLSLLLLIRNTTSPEASATLLKIIYPERQGAGKPITVSGWSILDNLRQKYANKKIYDLMQLALYFDICVTMEPSLKIQYLDHICSKYIDYGESEYKECRAVYPFITRRTFEVVTKYQRQRMNMLLKYLKFPEYQMEFIDLLRDKTLFELCNEDLVKMTGFDYFKDDSQEQQQVSLTKDLEEDGISVDNKKLETITPLNQANETQEIKDYVEDVETVTSYNITNEDAHRTEWNNKIETDVTGFGQERSPYMAQHFVGQDSEQNNLFKTDVNGKLQEDNWMGDWFDAFM